jgi:thioredoxin reductase (NADPH)
MMNRIYDTLIIGAGPAGLTAAIYLRRFLRDIIVIHDGKSRADWIPESHNFPGFVGGVSGKALLERLRAQLDTFGGGLVHGRVTALSRYEHLYEGKTLEQTIYARSVVLATGVVDLNPSLPGIEDIRRASLLRQCPVCDGFEFRGKKVAVLGDTEHAFREAQFLRSFCEDVSIVSVSSKMTDGPVLSQCSRADIPFFGSATRAVLHEDSERPVGFEFEHEPPQCFDVVYSACGADVQSSLATQLGACANEFGRLVVDAHCETSVTHLFATGDVVEGLGQLVVASAHGAIAATAIHNRLPRHLPSAG